jgi:lipopolysaccharide/colanic/teichoic acid biosynthesis glycosyltransferase
MTDPDSLVADLPPAVLGPAARRRALARRLGLHARLWIADRGANVRRALDVIGAALALAALAPLFLVVFLAIKIDSRGPIFYGQERFGRNGRRFRMWKLRTMVTNADALKQKLESEKPASLSGVRFKMKRDPRITRVGAVLRRLSIDELPQFWNVLVGDMTIVGPRPAIEREVSKYDVRALRRLEVEQGLTCLWQVGGRSDLTFAEQVTLDLDYIDRTTATEEIAILAKTVPAVLSGKGAY